MGLTFPYTPGYPFTDEKQFLVKIRRFEDLTEQRELHSRLAEHTMTMDFGRVDSQMASELASWFVARGGPFTAFALHDPITKGIFHVRFAEPDLGQERLGNMRRLPVISFTEVVSG